MPKDKLDCSDAEWREKLSPQQYRILREAATEPPWTGELLGEKREGEFRCAACGEPLFTSGAKYDSGSGWPSFTRPAEPDAVSEHQDVSHGMVRTEVLCRRCGSHLGHVFDDGPAPTGLRYCINGVSLDLEQAGD